MLTLSKIYAVKTKRPQVEKMRNVKLEMRNEKVKRPYNLYHLIILHSFLIPYYLFLISYLLPPSKPVIPVRVQHQS